MKKAGLILLLNVIMFNSCSDSEQVTESLDEVEKSTKRIEFFGNTQGTTYTVLCNDEIKLTHDEIDNTLRQFDLALSSYIPNSILTKLNKAPLGKFVYVDSFNYFNRCVLQSQEVYKLTNGSFDPTVYPLVDGWGFMKDIHQVPDSLTVDSLMNLIGFENGHHFTFNTNIDRPNVIKNTAHAKLDFNAIAQGLSVDVLCELLDAKGAKNYFVEIGGELRVKGLNSEGKLWTIGIDEPVEKSNAMTRTLQEIIQLDNKAVATSGSYRKFYEKNGVKYSHTLNPKTGYPVSHSLLSATVVATNCALADGLATAFMVMGPKESVKLIKTNQIKDVDIFLIFYNKKGRIETYSTKGFKNYILKK